MRYITTIGEREFLIEMIDESHIQLDGTVYQVDFDQIAGQPVYTLLLDGISYESFVYESPEGWQILLQGRSYQAQVVDEREKRLRAAMDSRLGERAEFHLKAPMPGLVVSIPVEDGGVVQKGDVLVLLESMKMQNELKSPRQGTVSRIRVHPGERVEQQQTLLSVT